MQSSAAAVDHSGVLVIDRKPVVHLTASVARSVGDLDDPPIARWLWDPLREAFPDALAAALLPDHPHLVTPHEDPAAAVMRLNRLLGQLGRKLGLGERAGIATPGRIIETTAELTRQLRYVDLNAPRKGLVACPLAWPWSTHRDVVGAIADPWITASRLAAALGDRRPGFVERYHAYVSADPACDVAGTPLPRARMLAMRAECSVRTIGRIGERYDPALVAAGRLCLGDARLQRTADSCHRRGDRDRHG